MPLPRLYAVGSDMHGRWDTEYLPMDPARYGDAPTCPRCGAFIGSRQWLEPLRVSITVHGEGPADFAFFGAGDFLIATTATETLREHAVTGVEVVRPVEVGAARGCPLRDLPQYVCPELQIGAAADVERTVIVSDRANPCEWCGPNAADAIGPIYIEESTWKDIDVFVPRRLPGVVLATERLVQAVEEASLTGIAFVEAEQHRWDPLGLLGH